MNINFFKNIYNRAKNNNTIDICCLYIKLIFYKIIPILISLSLFGYLNIPINIFRYIITIYLVINLLITDFILRQSIKIRINSEKEHQCDKCSTNIVWALQDNLANIIFYILGGILFKYNIYLDIYWRSYIHSTPICIKNKLCVEKTIKLQYIAIPFGFLDYLIELCLYKLSLPCEYVLIFMFFITFLIDCVIYNIGAKYKNNIGVINTLLKIVWRISQYIVIGYIEHKKRNLINIDIIDFSINKLNYLRNNTWYRCVLWNEFQSLDNFISLGITSVFYREHVLNTHEFLVTITHYLEKDPTLKFVRKTKILHIGSMFKPFMSSEKKFYLRMFDSRKSIEPFIKQLLSDLDFSITNTKSEIIYEAMYNFNKKVDNTNIKIIDKFYE
jgi:hypothetical protein